MQTLQTTMLYEAIFEFDYRTVAHSNRRDVHWAITQNAKKSEKAALAMAWMGAGRPRPPLPATVTFVRIAPRPLDEGDNLNSAFKYMRDELAARLGLKNDAGPEVTWLYAQERPTTPGRYAVRVEIRAEVRR